MWQDLSESKSENSKGLGLDSLHVINKVTLNDEKLVFLRIHMWIQSVRYRFTQNYIFYLELIITFIKNILKK